MKTLDEMRAHILEKATADESFRGKLIADPKTTIEEELGVTIPDGITVQVHENTAQQVHLVLPGIGKLSEKELNAAAAGSNCDGSNTGLTYN